MSRGKYLSLEEARQTGQLDQFCAEHPTEAERPRFLKILELMSKGALEAEETSQPDLSEGSSETQTHRDT
jgi:hypothetical protein